MEHVLDILEMDVLGCAAADADEVVVVRLVADAIAHGAVAEDDAADEAVVEHQLQGAVDGSSAHGSELSRELLGREVVVAPGDVLDHPVTRRRDLKTLVTQVFDEVMDG
jgi:hypothetical protein